MSVASWKWFRRKWIDASDSWSKVVSASFWWCAISLLSSLVRCAMWKSSRFCSGQEGAFMAASSASWCHPTRSRQHAMYTCSIWSSEPWSSSAWYVSSACWYEPRWKAA